MATNISAGMTVGGLATGLDTNSIITGLIGIEQQKVTREQVKQSDYQLQLSTFNDLKTKLSDFDAQAVAMNKTTALNIFAASSSDETIAKISGVDGASPGNFDVRVDSLASSLKIASKAFTKAQATNSMSLTGSFTISTSAAALKSDPTTTSVTIDLDGTETLKDIAMKINRSKGTGATAAVVQMGADDYRLMMTSVDEGTHAFSIDPTAGREAKSVFSDGLDLVNPAVGSTMVTTGAVHTTFDLKQATGGAATATTQFSQLFNGLGANNGITAGDKITITGTDATGAAIASMDFTVGATTDTLQKLLTTGDIGGNSIQAAFGGAGNVDVSVNSSGEIVVKDKTGGTSKTMSLSLSFTDADTSGSALSLGTSEIKSDYKNVISDGKKAFFLMNDIPFSSLTNKSDSTVQGTVFEFKKADPSTVKLTLDYDKAGITKTVQTFLDSYNMLLKFIDDKSKVEVHTPDPNNPQSTPQGLQSGTRSNVIKGPFAGDSSILGLRAQLQNMMTSKISELTDQGLSKFSSLAGVGITSEQKTGFLTINADTFNTALDTDFEGIKRLFVTNGYTTNPAHTFGAYTKDTLTGVYNIDPSVPQIDTSKDAAITTWSAAELTGGGAILNSTTGDSNGMAIQAASGSGTGKVTFVRGVAGQISAFYDKISNYVDGFLTSTGKGYQQQIDDETTQMDRLQKQVDAKKQQLTTQFANLELAVSKLQSQSAAFSGQISSIKR